MSENAFLTTVLGDVWEIDPDNTIEAKMFYQKYWKDLLESDIGRFRGDTLISFNRMAGGIIWLRIAPNEEYKFSRSQEERHEIIMNSAAISEALKQKFDEFYRLYHSFANFMPLVKASNHSLNLMKNSSCNDFPDNFFQRIRGHYTEKKDGYEKFNIGKNKDYFQHFGCGQKGWTNFVERNYLQPFFEDDKYIKSIQLTPKAGCIPTSAHVKKWLRKSKEKKVEIEEQIEIFLDNAIKIIKARAVLLNSIE